MKSHPPTLLTLARRTILDEALFDRPDPRTKKRVRVLVGVSGGPDSMALLHVLARLRDKLGHDLWAHGVNHGLRSEAARELEQAEALARLLDVPWSWTDAMVEPGGNLQARARSARLHALRAAAAKVGASRIATGHHADDRAETVLLRILRGASPHGLAVLPPRRGDLIRPFIRARRADIDAHLLRHELPYASDPSNHDPRFLRARVRDELLPLLQSLSPGIVRHLNGIADDLRAPPYSSAVGNLDAYEAAYISPLPRATRVALAALAASKSRTGRVKLAHGLVVSFEASPTHRERSPREGPPNERPRNRSRPG
jgi:tRNA(Ile)-lysidine synthase